MNKKTPIQIGNYPIYLVYAQSISKKDDIKVQDSENGTKIYYLYRKDVYTLDVSFKCNGDVGQYIDNAVSNSVQLSVTFAEVGKYVTKTMIATSRSYRCITLSGKEFWDMSVTFEEV
mgnify:CR=1 FL=1